MDTQPLEFQTPSPLGVQIAEVTPEKARVPSLLLLNVIYDLQSPFISINTLDRLENKGSSSVSSELGVITQTPALTGRGGHHTNAAEYFEGQPTEDYEEGS